MEESEKVKEFKVAVEDGPDLGDFIAGVVPRWVAAWQVEDWMYLCVQAGGGGLPGQIEAG